MDDLEKQIKSLEKKLTKIAQVDTDRAYSSAINKTANSIKSHVVKKVSGDVKITQKNIRRKIYVKRSTPKTGMAKLYFYGRAVNAINTNFSKTAKGYKIAGTFRPRTFFAKSPTANKHLIFQRRGAERLPVDVVKIPINEAVQKHAMPTIKERMNNYFYKTLKAEFNARLKGYVSSNN